MACLRLLAHGLRVAPGASITHTWRAASGEMPGWHRTAATLRGAANQPCARECRMNLRASKKAAKTALWKLRNTWPSRFDNGPPG